MEILITGNLSPVSEPLFTKLRQSHTLAITSTDLVPEQLNQKDHLFPLSADDPRFDKIFNSYHFDAAIFLGWQMWSGERGLKEFQALAQFLKACSAHNIHQVLYLQHKYGLTAEGQLSDESDPMLEACSSLCDHYRDHCGMSVLRCGTPLLYGYGETSSLIGSILADARKSSVIHFPGCADQKVALLSQRDMGELLLRMMENWTSEYRYMDIPAAEILSFRELGELVKKHIPNLKVSYLPRPEIPVGEYTLDACLLEYDWSPVHSLDTEIAPIMRRQAIDVQSGKLSTWQKIKNFFKAHSTLLKTIELILGFIVMELLVHLSGSSVQFRYIDFRLLYVVILGTVYGMNMGLWAAGLASLSLLVAMVSDLRNWSGIIYDVNTWLPFIFLFLIGSVTGYIKDRLKKDNKFLTDEKAQLEERYVLLSEFYTSALQNKNKYRTQIMSYRNSFGRLFDVTRNLDSTVVDEVFNEALAALEDILDNHSVAIYSCKDSTYGRLIICSKEIRRVTPRSLRLQDQEQMVSQLQDGEVWVNRARLADYPDYAVPIYQDGELSVLIVLKTASYDQMSVYYENLIKIVCGLFKISLVHAVTYSDMAQDEMYLPGTQILNYEHFRKVIQANESREQQGTSEYVLLHINSKPDAYAAVSDKLQHLIRTTDAMGVGKDGQLYLALSQTNEDNLKFVLGRLDNAGISYGDQETGDRI